MSRLSLTIFPPGAAPALETECTGGENRNRCATEGDRRPPGLNHYFTIGCGPEVQRLRPRPGRVQRKEIPPGANSSEIDSPPSPGPILDDRWQIARQAVNLVSTSERLVACEDR